MATISLIVPGKQRRPVSRVFNELLKIDVQTLGKSSGEVLQSLLSPGSPANSKKQINLVVVDSSKKGANPQINHAYAKNKPSDCSANGLSSDASESKSAKQTKNKRSNKSTKSKKSDKKLLEKTNRKDSVFKGNTGLTRSLSFSNGIYEIKNEDCNQTPNYERKLLKIKPEDNCKNGYVSDSGRYTIEKQFSEETMKSIKAANDIAVKQRKTERRFSVGKKNFVPQKSIDKSHKLNKCEVNVYSSSAELDNEDGKKTTDNNNNFGRKTSPFNRRRFSRQQKQPAAQIKRKKQETTSKIIYVDAPNKHFDEVANQWPAMSLFYSGRDSDIVTTVYEVKRRLKKHLKNKPMEVDDASSPSDTDSSFGKGRRNTLAKKVWSSIHSLLQVDDTKPQEKASIGSAYVDLKGLSRSLPADLDKEPCANYWFVRELYETHESRVEDECLSQPRSSSPVVLAVNNGYTLTGRIEENKELNIHDNAFSLRDENNNTNDDETLNRVRSASSSLTPQPTAGLANLKKNLTKTYSANNAIQKPKTRPYKNLFSTYKNNFDVVLVQYPSKHQRISPQPKKTLQRASVSVDTPDTSFLQNQQDERRRSKVTQILFNGLRADVKCKLANYFSDKTYDAQLAGGWSRTLSESIKERITHVTGDFYKVTCQIFLSAIVEDGVHSATQTSCSKASDECFTVAHRTNHIFALASIVAIEIN